LIEAIDHIKHKVRAILDDSEVIKQGELLGREYVGVVRNQELYDDISRWRKFFTFSAFYGHRFGSNLALVADLRPGQGMDLYITDSDGIMKNRVNDLNASERITKAKKERKPVILLFGGSTMMGAGARLPEFTIPALLEIVLKSKYGIDTVCVNYGLGGTMCTEAFHILIHEALSTQPDIVIFYDGWNCCSYLSIAEALRQHNLPERPLNIFRGTGIRQLEHDLVLSKQFNALDLFWRSSCVALNKFATFCVSYFKFPILRRIFNSILTNYFSLRPSNTMSYLIKKISKNQLEIDRVAESAVEQYLRIHEMANTICQQYGVKFLTFIQPLVFWGNKPLTEMEAKWKESGFSSGDPRIFNSFYEVLSRENRNVWLHDFTNIFDTVEEKLYIDSGHINRLGNFIVADKLSDVLYMEIENELIN
jgi:hypothetical protein